MAFLTADGHFLTRLRGLSERVEVRDPEGNVLGHYTPAMSPEVRAIHEKAKGLFDLEEAERVFATEKGGHTTQEVLRWLESLGKTE